MKKIAIINGPNLNLLGTREKEWYGGQSLENINSNLKNVAEKLGISLDFMQSNLEGELINYLHSLRGSYDFLIINAGAYSHTSIAIRDALAAIALPFIEVHISNVDRREEFRKNSYLSDLASGVIYGFGTLGYELALYGAEKLLFDKNLIPIHYNK